MSRYLEVPREVRERFCDEVNNSRPRVTLHHIVSRRCIDYVSCIIISPDKGDIKMVKRIAKLAGEEVTVLKEDIRTFLDLMKVSALNVEAYEIVNNIIKLEEDIEINVF